MKIRNGFVSNSSSSSFVLITKEISIDDLKKIQHPGYGEGLYAQGDDLGEGLDFFQLDSTMINFLSKHYFDSTMINFLSKHYYDGDPDHTQLLFYMVYWRSEHDGSVINKKTWDKIGNILPNENVSIECKEISQHYTEDLATMRKRYFPDVIDEDEQKQKELDAYNKIKEYVKKEKEYVKKEQEKVEKVEEGSSSSEDFP